MAEKNFRDIEYLVPRAFFEQSEIEVKTISSAKISHGRFGYRVENNFVLGEKIPENFDAIFCVGGNGSLDFLYNEIAKNLVKNFIDTNKKCGAICAAPRLLLHWGFLTGKNCTGWNGDGQVPVLCQKFGAEFLDKTVVKDGNFITGNGPTASEEFALAMIEE